MAALGVPEEGVAVVPAAQEGSGAEEAVAVAALAPAAALRKGDAVQEWARCTASATW